LLASLARLYFEVFDELMQQQVPVDDEYEAAKALVFTMFSELEMLQEAQQQPILAVLKDERKKLAIDFLYFEGMLLCTFETPQQLARLVKDYRATYGTCGRKFAEFAFSWLEEHQQLYTLLQVAEAAPEDARDFFEVNMPCTAELLLGHGFLSSDISFRNANDRTGHIWGGCSTWGATTSCNKWRLQVSTLHGTVRFRPRSGV
jgi:hypothetical protein